MGRSRWQEVRSEHQRADAEAFIAKMRADSDPGCKWKLKEERRQHWYSGQGETQYIVYMLCPGVY